MKGVCCGKLQGDGIFLSVIAAIIIGASYIAVANGMSPATDITFNGNSTANFDSDGNFSINWTAASDAGLYYIYNSTNSGAYGINFTNTSITGYSVSGAAAGQNITFIVQAVNATNSSDMANATSSWIYIDSAAPAITIQSPSNRTYAASVWFNITLSETNPSWVGYSLDGAANVSMNSTSGAWSALNSSMVQGAHSVIFYANDSAGNANMSGTVYFTVDTTSPAVQILLPQNTTYNSVLRALNYTANDTNMSSVWYQYNGINTTISGNTAFTALGNQQSVLILYANDSAGNINSTSVTFTIDTAAPSVSLNSPQNGVWISSGKLNFTFTAEDSMAGFGNCSLWLNTTGAWQLNMTNASVINGTASVFAFDDGSNVLTNGTYLWNVQCYDNASNPAFASQNYTFTVGAAPDFIVLSIAVANSSNTQHPDRPVPGSNITLNTTVMNNGSADFSGNLTVFLYWGGSVVNITNITGLSSGGQTSLLFNISSSLVSDVNAAKAVLDLYNTVRETNESNNELTKTVLTGLNVTILSITPLNPGQGQSITVNLSISYQDGDPATNISWQNVTQIIDYYIAGVKSTAISNSSAFVTTGKAAGNYWFNITAASRNATTLRADAGNHTIFMFVVDNSSGRLYNNSWAINGAQNSTSKQYELQAPDISLRFDPSITYSLDLASASSKSFNIQIKNNGTANISNVNISILSNSTSLTLSKNAINYSIGVSCNYTETLSPMTNSSFSQVSFCTVFFSTTTAANYFITLYAGGFDSNSTQYNSTPVTQLISVTNSTTAASTSSGSGGSGSTAATYVYMLNITAYNSSLRMEQGTNATIYFTVKNTGNGTIKNITFSMSLPIGTDWKNWSSVPPMIPRLIEWESRKVQVTVSVPANASIGTYNISAKFMGLEPGASRTATFLLNVIPGTTEKKVINASLSDLEEELARINATLLSLAGSDNENLTVAKNKLSKAAGLILEAKAAISKGDYLSVYDLRAEIETLLSSSREIMDAVRTTTERQEKRTSQIYIVVAVLAAASAFLYYLMLPEEGYNPKTGYNFKGAEKPLIERMRNMLGSAANHLRFSPDEAIRNISEKSRRSKLLANPKPAVSYAPADAGVSGKLKKISSNLKDQLREYRKADKRQVYNFQKKKTWDSIS